MDPLALTQAVRQAQAYIQLADSRNNEGQVGDNDALVLATIAQTHALLAIAATLDVLARERRTERDPE